MFVFKTVFETSSNAPPADVNFWTESNSSSISRCLR